nr:type IV pili methyl-accepting chemotaxis transducer N-terminal domain-containing protein [Desulfobulbaceae bacterium]
MLERMNLSWKFVSILCVLLGISVINALIIFSVVNQQIASGRAINLAGRQRMLSQKMSKEIFIYSTAVGEAERKSARSDAEKTAALFDTTLNGLLNGDKSQGLAAVDNAETKRKLLEVQAMWKEFLVQIKIAIGNAPGSAESMAALSAIQKTNVPLLKTMNEAVGLFESNNNLGKIKLIQGVLLTIAFCVTGAAWYFVQTSIVGPLRNVSGIIGESSRNIDALSGSVASASESIADGSSSQAAATEQSSASLEEITSMTRQNAENTSAADAKMRATKATAEQANSVMEDMNTSMAEILKASEETQKIVKTIDEIAFQTNLLSLNAAVEAARAGEAGAGFAVVADEVRNLALRSAESAKDTATLIENIVQRIQGGSTLVKKATESFREVAAGAGEVAILLDEINTANNEQSLGVSQISTGIHEMDRLTQESVATSEEAAATAAEMAAEATQLSGVVSRLVELVEGVGAVEKVVKGAVAPDRGTKLLR